MLSLSLIAEQLSPWQIRQVFGSLTTKAAELGGNCSDAESDEWMELRWKLAAGQFFALPLEI